MMPLCAAAIKPSPQLGVAFYTGLAEVAGYPEWGMSPKPRRPARVSPPPLSTPALLTNSSTTARRLRTSPRGGAHTPRRPWGGGL